MKFFFSQRLLCVFAKSEKILLYFLRIDRMKIPSADYETPSARLEMLEMAENTFTNSIKITHKDANFTYCFSVFGKI
jgi:hypothetical protein